jgi:site-specific DNA-methyltransferase (adenine-specific)
VHYCKILLDEIFGRQSFINEIIWAYDFGGRSKTRWPAKHDNILFYAKDPHQYTFNWEAVERIPYMAPGLVGKEKAERGKFPTDTWWHTIVGTNSKEKTGYPTQKPVGVLRRIISASSNPGDLVLDFFAGSGTIGEVCLAMERNFMLIDNNPQAIAVMQARFKEINSIEWIGIEAQSAS